MQGLCFSPKSKKIVGLCTSYRTEMPDFAIFYSSHTKIKSDNPVPPQPNFVICQGTPHCNSPLTPPRLSSAMCRGFVLHRHISRSPIKAVPRRQLRIGTARRGFVYEYGEKTLPARRSGFASVFKLYLVGDKRDKFRVGGLALAGVDRVAEEGV